MERAQEEAERIVARAQEQAAFLIEERELTRAAEPRSQQIVAEGHGEADEIRQGADEYAASVLVRLEGECVKALQSIRRGLPCSTSGTRRRARTRRGGREDAAEPHGGPRHAQL